MYSSYSPSKRIVSVPIWAIQLFLLRSVSSLNLTNLYLHHICRVNEGTYKPGSKYEENLNYLTKSVANEKFPKGFTHVNYGEAPSSVSIIFQCRLDSYGSKCRSCFATALAGLRTRCLRNKGAIIWYDQCFLDISPIDRPPPRKMDFENTFSMHNPKKMSGNIDMFSKKIRDYMYNLTLKTEQFDADGVNLLYYATGEERYDRIKIYAMVQCVGDIISCKDCLIWSVQQLPVCCDGKQGARVLGTSCNLRYELYPFLRT